MRKPQKRQAKKRNNLLSCPLTEAGVKTIFARIEACIDGRIDAMCARIQADIDRIDKDTARVEAGTRRDLAELGKLPENLSIKRTPVQRSSSKPFQRGTSGPMPDCWGRDEVMRPITQY